MDQYSLPYHTIGSGTNLLISDGGISEAVITTELVQGIIDEPWGLVVDSGTSIREVVHHAIRSSRKGMEKLYGLPGTVGGAIAGNAGCFGMEISDVIRYVEVYVRDTESIVRLSKDDCGFSYRSSIIRERGLIVLGAGLELSSGDPGVLEAEAGRCWDQRIRHGHFRFPSAGSVFKRPIYPEGHDLTGTSAGELVEMAGLKGHRIGGAVIAPYHANIIINPDFTATSQDVLNLMTLAQDTVSQRFAVSLVPELILLGDWPRFP